MNKALKSQRSKYEKIILVMVVIVVSFGIAYMVNDYVTTMGQLDNLKEDVMESSSLTGDSSINSILNDTDR